MKIKRPQLIKIISIFIFTQLPGLYNDWDQIIGKIRENGNFFDKVVELLNIIFLINYKYFIFSVFIVICWISIYRYLILRGVRGNKVILINAIRRHKHGLIDLIYKFELSLKTYSNDILNSTNLNDEKIILSAKSNLGHLLQELQQILIYVGIKDVSLNIKVFVNTENGNITTKSRSSFNKLFIKTYVRVVSKYEKDKYDKNILAPRRGVGQVCHAAIFIWLTNLFHSLFLNVILKFTTCWAPFRVHLCPDNFILF